MPECRCLITGGAGFIGSFIARALLERDIPVVLQDAFAQYYSPLDPRAPLYHRYIEERLGPLRGRVTMVRGDTRHKTAIRRILEQQRPTHVIHLAALPIAELSNEYTEEAVESILLGCINLLEAIRDLRTVTRFVYVSSSMVYGDFAYTPADETHPTRPKEIYGGAKLCGEIMVQTFARRFGLEYAIVRPSAVYGPTDVNRRVSQIFVENALRGEPLVLKGGGDVALDFTFVTDAAQGLVLAALEPGGRNEIFNITRGEHCTLRAFAQALKQLVPGTQVIEEAGDTLQPRRGALDISKARGLLGYEPRYSLEDGLKVYVEFVATQLQREEHDASGAAIPAEYRASRAHSRPAGAAKRLADARRV